MMQRDLDMEKKIMLKAYIGAARGCLELMEELADKAPSQACGYAYAMKTVMDKIIDLYEDD